MKKLNKIFTFVITILSIGFLKVDSVFAQAQPQTGGLCGIFPCDVASPCLGSNCGTNSLSLVGTLLQAILSLIFVGILIYGIWLIIQAALKIIRSDGDEAKIQEGTKLIKGAYIGLALIFVGIIGLVIVFAIFNATSLFRVSPEDAPPGITLS